MARCGVLLLLSLTALLSIVYPWNRLINYQLSAWASTAEPHPLVLEQKPEIRTLHATWEEDVDLAVSEDDGAPYRQLQGRRRRRGPNSDESDRPRNALGFLCEDNPMVEDLGAKCRTISRNIGSLGCERKIVDLATEMGRNVDAIPQVYRTARVADACPESCGLCELCAPGCPKWFIGNGYCEEECNNADCQFDGGDCWDSDCVVGDWSDWSECSITCDRGGAAGIGGTETRTRAIVSQKLQNGKPCPSLTETRTGCNKGVPCPVPCRVGEWGPWSNCSVECGPGQMTRSRDVLQEPEHGATKCPELTQTRSCLLPECSRECKLGEWQEWGECSNSCGNGTRIRKRSIEIPPSVGLSCPPTFETEDCIGTRCDDIVAEACALQPWGEWSPCSAECGDGGTQVRKRQYAKPEDVIKSTLGPYGAVCPSVSFSEEQPCNQVPCNTDCRLSPWSEWSSCNATCGEGKRYRSRTVLQKSEGAGAACPDMLRQEEACFVGDCDCVVSDWSPWSDCTTVGGQCGLGLRTRTRSIKVLPAGGGAPCPALTESEECRKPCQIPCQLGSSVPWSDCKSECQVEGKKPDSTVFSYRWKQLRLLTSTCPEPSSLVETRSCGLYGDVCVDATENDCIVSDWSAWTACSAGCGGGTRTRTRVLMRPARPGGKECPSLREIEDCGTAPCPHDCQMGEWSPWSSCSVSCGQGTMTRSREVLVAASTDPPGAPCGPSDEVSPCVGADGACDQDCQVGEWTSWSECSTPCGPYGTMSRSREVTLPPTGRGKSCPPLSETKQCNDTPCEDECMVSDWSPWSSCSVTCGLPADGEQIRTRQILRPAGPDREPCPTNLQETRPCVDIFPCPIACELSKWSDWSPCPSECGIGEQVRTREVLRQPQHGGAPCGPLREVIECFVKPCEVDCEVGEWTPWTACSAECNGGVRTRRRDVIQRPSSNGTACPDLFEFDDCNLGPCPEDMGINPADCQVSPWGNWSQCPVECGGGVHKRNRTILVCRVTYLSFDGSMQTPAKPGGAPCPELEEIKGCGLSRCKDKPCEDNAGILEEHGVTCAILKAQGCDANIKDLGKSKGIPYPPDMPPEARVKDACPVTCDVCKECAPGCQLRDLGNTICDQSCNNEACEFDLGDCGGACKMPLPVPGSLELVPAATGLELDQTVKVSCSSQAERFSLVPELSEIIIACKDDSSGSSTGVLELQPADAFFNRVPYPFKDFAPLACSPDVCASVGVTGFQNESSRFNGVYDRGASPNGRTHYIQNKKSPDLKEAKASLHHFWMDPQDATAKKLHAAMSANHAAQGNRTVPSPGNFAWRLTPWAPDDDKKTEHQGLSAAVLSTCRLPLAGQAANFTTCLASAMPWAVTDETQTNELLWTSGITVRCLDKDERKELLKRKPVGGIPGGTTDGSASAAVYENGRPVTFLEIPGQEEPKKIFCEDQPEVPKIAGMPCSEIVSALGCTFLLKDTGQTLPDYLPPQTTVAQVCPETCDLCDDECAPGCPIFFLGNTHCDPGCNNAPCDFDKGDCAGVTPPSATHIARGEDGRPFTILEAPGIEPRKAYCEDQPEVEEVAKMDCEEIVDTLGCNFLLKDTGKPIPDFLPPETTVGLVCPGTCELCDEDCAPGCPTWFLGNRHCDAACNVKACQFDKGDCQGIPPGTGAMTTTRKPTASSCHDKEEVAHYGYSCSVLKTLGSEGCNTLIISIKDSGGQSHLAPPAGYPNTTKVRDVCPQTCDYCHPTTPPPLAISTTAKGLQQHLDGADDLDCQDDHTVIDLGYTCALLKAVATNKFGSCNATLLDIAKEQGETLTLPKGVPPITRVLDACPVTCGCCECWRLKKPRPRPENWVPPPPKSTLEKGEFPNCIDDPRVNDAAGMNCYDLVESVGGNCFLTLGNLTTPDTLPAGIPANLTVAETCGYSCGKCPVCEDQRLVKETTQYDCQQVVEMLNGNCEYYLKDLGTVPAEVPAMAQLKHACPSSCHVCPGEAQRTASCKDHPQIEAMGYTCDVLVQVALNQCTKKLKEMGISTARLPSDLSPDATIAEACPFTCQTCSTSNGAKCGDNPMVEKMNATCPTLIQLGPVGCQSLLRDIARDIIPSAVPKTFKVVDVCEGSCGQCVEPTCSDGFQNGDETGIDCGGSCRPCRPCSPGPLKALGAEYFLEGSGKNQHNATRTVRCADGYVRLAGPEPDTLYCRDGSFTKLSLSCGDPRVDVLKGTVRVFEGEDLDASAVPSIQSALEATLGLPPSAAIRIVKAGNCGEMTDLTDFVCEDNPAVAETGFDCALLSRLGCGTVLSDLASSQGVSMPPGIPKEATVGDACPITCNTCDFLKRRMKELLAAGGSPDGSPTTTVSSDNTSEQASTQCLRVDFLIRDLGAGDKAALESLSTQMVLNKDTLNTKLTSALASYFGANNVKIRTYSENKEPLLISAEKAVLEKPMSSSFTKPSIASVPISDWEAAYDAREEQADARSVFVAPGIPLPVFDATDLPHGWSATDIVGQMYRPVFGIGGDTSVVGDKENSVTGWFDSFASAAVVSAMMPTLKGECTLVPPGSDSGDCCGAKAELQQFLSGSCGLSIYGAVVTDADMADFCFGTALVASHERKDGEDAPVSSHETASCYELALEIVDRYESRGGAACALIPYLKTFIHSWCSKEGIFEILNASERVRRDTSVPFCFPQLKSTLQQRFDLLYIATLSDQEMETLCQPASCTRQHLRYVDALAQLQLGWLFAGAPSYAGRPVSHSEHADSSPNDDHVRNEEPSSGDPASSSTFSRRLLRFDTEDQFPPVFMEHLEATLRLAQFFQREATQSVSLAERVFFRQLQSEPSVAPPFSRSRRTIPRSHGHQPSAFGIYVGDYAEEFLDFVCTKVQNQYCQQTLLLLTTEDPVHNPTLLKNPCTTPCFIPMTGALGGLVQSFGDRQENPYYSALGSILRSYARFYCVENGEGVRCGDYLFKKMMYSRYPSYTGTKAPTDSVLLKRCGCPASFINDGQCDWECYTADCLWDGDDCRVATMFPEAYYALLDAFAETDPAATTIKTAPNSTGIPRTPDVTSCLLYDPAFSCNNKCRRLYEVGNNLQGCCFSAALEALGNLLTIDKQHPAATHRWVTDRSMTYLEQACEATFDRTCAGGRSRKTLKVDLVLSNVAFSSFSKSSAPSLTNIGPSNGALREIVDTLREALAEKLRLVNQDIGRAVVRDGGSDGLIIEYSIDSGVQNIFRVEKLLHRDEELEKLSVALNRRLERIPLEPYRQVARTGLPHVSIPAASVQTRTLFSPLASLGVTASLPYAGSYGVGAALENSLPSEGCTSEALWSFGAGYRILATTGTSVSHGSTREIRCSHGYKLVKGTDPDELVCDNGRWVTRHFITCERPCPTDLWAALKLRTDKTAYIVKGLPSQNQPGVTRTIVCATGYTAARGRTPTTTTCRDGVWTPITLDCRKQCDAYTPPDEDAYVVEQSRGLSLTHGSQRVLTCAAGYFPTPALTDRVEAVTECQDGVWSRLAISCVRPETIDPRAGPSMFAKIAGQLFSRTGVMGFIVAAIIAVICVTSVTIAWKLYYRRKATLHTYEYEHQMDQVAKMAARTSAGAGKGGTTLSIGTAHCAAALSTTQSAEDDEVYIQRSDDEGHGENDVRRHRHHTELSENEQDAESRQLYTTSSMSHNATSRSLNHVVHRKSSSWSRGTRSPSLRRQDDRRLQQQNGPRYPDEEYFGDVELTPPLSGRSDSDHVLHPHHHRSYHESGASAAALPAYRGVTTTTTTTNVMRRLRPCRQSPADVSSCGEASSATTPPSSSRYGGHGDEIAFETTRRPNARTTLTQTLHRASQPTYRDVSSSSRTSSSSCVRRSSAHVFDISRACDDSSVSLAHRSANVMIRRPTYDDTPLEFVERAGQGRTSIGERRSAAVRPPLAHQRPSHGDPGEAFSCGYHDRHQNPHHL